MDVSGLLVTLHNHNYKQYRYEISIIVRRMQPNPFLEIRYNFTNINDVIQMFQNTSIPHIEPQIESHIESHIDQQPLILEDREFLPYNFANHNENVMTSTVVKSVKQTIDFLICQVNVDPNRNTLAEIRDAFNENATFLEKHKFSLFMLAIGCANLGLHNIDIISTTTTMLLYGAQGILMYMFGKTDRINKHLEYMYNHTDNAYFMQYGIDVTYKQLLDLTWEYIRKHKYRKELVQRLKQEVYESLHVCYHGNMVRLANVLQGFEDNLYPPISGEIVQITISRIASLNIPSDEKIQMATNSLIEFGLNEEQRQSWIIAIQDL